MRCKNCGFNNDDGRYICENCGSPLYDESAEIAEAEDNPDSADTDTEDINEIAQSSEESKNKKSLIIIIVLAVILVALIVGIIVSAATNKNKEPETESVSISTSSETESREHTTKKATTEKTTKETTTESTTRETTTKETTTEKTTAAPVIYNVYVDIDGNGTVSGDGAFKAGEKAVLIATPAENAQFDGWYDNATGKLVASGSKYTITVSKDISLTAKFISMEAPQQ